MIFQSLRYAEKGWNVFPLVPNNKNPLTQNGFKDATKNPDQIRAWWEDKPLANIGIATGKESGFFVIDIDVKNGAKGLESLKTISLPPTLSVKTPSGGWHFYFQYREGMKCKNGILPGIDIKTEGGYVVAPPSVIDGNYYQWADDSHLIAELPLSVFQYFSSMNSREKQKGRSQEEPILKNGRNTRLASIAGAMRRQGCSKETIEAALTDFNSRRCVPPLPIGEILTIANSISRYPPSVPKEAPDLPKLIDISTTVSAEVKRIDKKFSPWMDKKWEEIKMHNRLMAENILDLKDEIDETYAIFSMGRGSTKDIENAISRYERAWEVLAKRWPL